MSNFWDKLTEPMPFYTVENVGDTIEFVKECPDTMYYKIFRSALEWVTAVLTKRQARAEFTDKRFLKAARESAQEERDKAIFEKDYVAAVRWRYVMAAISDHRRYLILTEEAVI